MLVSVILLSVLSFFDQSGSHTDELLHYIPRNYFTNKDSIPIYILLDTIYTLDTTGMALTGCITETATVGKKEIPLSDLRKIYPECLPEQRIIKAYWLMI